MAFVIGVSAFVAVTLIFVSLYTLLREREEQSELTKKIKDFSRKAETEIVQDGVTLPTQPVARQFARIIRYFGNLTKPQKKEEISLIQKRFLRAGIRNRNVIITFFGAKVICAVCLSMGFVAAMVLFQLNVPVLFSMTVVIWLSFAGFYLPNLWLSLKTSRRQDAFLRGFPDALDLLGVCVEAGMGLDAAIKRVGDEMRLSNKVLSDEFGLLNLEMRAGKERKEAMKSMADRVDLEDVRSWVSMLIQTDRFGTSIGHALQVHSNSLRIKRSQRLEELAAKLPVKLLFPTILCIFPSMLLVIMGPALIRIFKMFSGH